MAFKMKGSPMYRNYGIGSPMKDGKPVPGATNELLKGLGAMGTGSDIDPTVIKNKDAEQLRGVRVGSGYNDMSDDERRAVREKTATEMASNEASANAMRDRDVTGADIASQARTRARKNANQAERDERNKNKAAALEERKQRALDARKK
jgi:hypothetical protein